jgi:transcriptional regulator with XRE-family HTH domain
MRDQFRAYRLRELREESELTQVALAQLLQVSQNRVSRIERGELDRTQLDTLRRYVEALGGTLHLQAEFNGERVELV